MYIHAVLSLSPLLQNGNTPLMKAADWGREDTVKELLSSGASVYCTNKVKKKKKIKFCQKSKCTTSDIIVYFGCA